MCFTRCLFKEFNFLTLGTYGTLREIDFIQDLCSTHPELNEYYMGFYIHTCQKMRYKGKLQPSYLLCPEIYSWHLINDGNLYCQKLFFGFFFKLKVDFINFYTQIYSNYWTTTSILASIWMHKQEISMNSIRLLI